MTGHRWIWQIAFAIAIAYFVARGPWRGFHDASDFVLILDSSRCWVEGRNPYLPRDLATCSRGQATEGGFVRSPQVHPPSTFLFLAPLTFLPPEIARGVWVGILLAMVILAGIKLAYTTTLWTLQASCLALAFAPVHTALRLGQTSAMTCALVAISVTIEQPYLSGGLLGLSACFKPHLAAGFFLLSAMRCEWRKLAAAASCCSVAMGISLVHLKAGSLATWLSMASSLATGSGLGSGSSANPLSYQLLNVDTLIPGQLYGAFSAGTLYLVILMLSAWAVLKAKDAWIAIAIMAATSAMIGYHRFYDASILCLGIPVLLSVRKAMRWLWGCYLVFLIPGQAIASAQLGDAITGILAFIALRHEVLACLAIWAGFVWMATGLTRPQFSRPAEVSKAHSAPRG